MYRPYSAFPFSQFVTLHHLWLARFFTNYICYSLVTLFSDASFSRMHSYCSQVFMEVTNQTFRSQFSPLKSFTSIDLIANFVQPWSTGKSEMRLFDSKLGVSGLVEDIGHLRDLRNSSLIRKFSLFFSHFDLLQRLSKRIKAVSVAF